MVTPSRVNFLQQLIEYNDAYLTSNAGLGYMSEVLSNIDIIYCPTRARWLALMTALHVPRVPTSAQSTGEPLFSFMGSLDIQPTLLVLHEPSTFFDSENLSDSETFSSYIHLIISGISAASFLSAHSSTPTRVALFDSNLTTLKLPIVKKSVISRTMATNDHGADSDDNEIAHDADDSRKREPLLFAVQRFFEWTATSTIIGGSSASNSSIPLDSAAVQSESAGLDASANPTHRMTLVPNNVAAPRTPGKGSEEPGPMVWEWEEYRVDGASPWAQKQRTQIRWSKPDASATPHP